MHPVLKRKKREEELDIRSNYHSYSADISPGKFPWSHPGTEFYFISFSENVFLRWPKSCKLMNITVEFQIDSTMTSPLVRKTSVFDWGIKDQTPDAWNESCLCHTFLKARKNATAWLSASIWMPGLLRSPSHTSSRHCPRTERYHPTGLEQTKVETGFQRQGHIQVKVALGLESEALVLGSSSLLVLWCPRVSWTCPLKGMPTWASGYMWGWNKNENVKRALSTAELNANVLGVITHLYLHFQGCLLNESWWQNHMRESKEVRSFLQPLRISPIALHLLPDSALVAIRT